MYANMNAPEPPRGHGELDRQQRSRSFGHGALELPRPLEPRPTHHLQTAYSDSSGALLRRDAFRSSPVHTLDHRPQVQSLPGLRDILTTRPHVTPPAAYSAPWQPNGPSSTMPNGGDSQHASQHVYGGWHPPMALQSHGEPGHPLQSYHPRRLELPILETSPLSRHPAQSAPVSPYTGFTDGREGPDTRSDSQRQPSAASFALNGTSGGYPNLPSDEAQYMSPGAVHDRSESSGVPTPGPECQRKYLGVKDVRGEGTYHVYEGGYRIPTQVDGEHVNPAWGLTKANKPRKRLALACLDCREKKIKCEPGASSCLQCEKAKRPCRRYIERGSGASPSEWKVQGGPTHHPNGDLASPGGTRWTAETISPVRKSASDPTPSHSLDLEQSKRRSRDDPSPPAGPSKKHRSASPMISPGGSDFPKPFEGARYSAAIIAGPSFGLDLPLAWEHDPYAVEPETTLHLLDLYFAHVNGATYGMFPRRTFLEWVRTSTDKCQNERMTLYAMLAMGSVFAVDHLSGFGRRCAQIATDAVAAQVGRFNICAVQTRILAALYHYMKGSYSVAWDYAGGALRAAMGVDLRLNIDHDLDSDRVKKEELYRRSRVEFCLSPEQLAECRRRTFWSCMLIDRFGHGPNCSIDLEDVSLRLPCADELYEHSAPSSAPYYENGVVEPAWAILTPSSPVSAMAWLVLIGGIWGDVLNFMDRSVRRGSFTYREAYESFHEETRLKVQKWRTRLPEHLRYGKANLDRAIQGGYADTFVTMHATYHYTLMRLNRCVRHAMMHDLVGRNIRAAHHHAHELLAMMGELQAARRTVTAPGPGQPSEYIMAQPFTGFMITSAIDVVSAGGLDSQLKTTLEDIEGGIGCLQEIARYWNTAREQLRDSSQRLLRLRNVLTRPWKAQSGCWLGRQWGMFEPLESEFDKAHDCIYGITDDGGSDGWTKVYFDALKDGAHGDRPPGGLRIA